MKTAIMRLFLFLFLLEIRVAVGVTHSLKYCYTASYGGTNIPEFISLQLVDDVLISHCDSITNRNVPKQEWMNSITEEDPQYWERQTEICVDQQLWFKYNIETVKEHLNQTGGTHVLQYMYGCDWDDQTDEVNGYRKFGYDGEDFLVWDKETNTWVPAHHEALMTKMRWDRDKAELERTKQFLTHDCPEYLKKFVGYGRSSLMRTVLPSVSLLQKNSSSPITCHATGFYPNRAKLVWRKDGEELHEGVFKEEILPNNDETFQMSADLDLRFVPAEDWRRYDCVFNLTGVNEDIITKLEKAVIKADEGNSLSMVVPVIVAVVVLAVIAVIGFIIYKKRTDKRPPSPVENREVQEQMIPKA